MTRAPRFQLEEMTMKAAISVVLVLGVLCVTPHPASARKLVSVLCTGPFRRAHDLTGRRIENSMIERLEPDTDILAVHFFSRPS